MIWPGNRTWRHEDEAVKAGMSSSDESSGSELSGFYQYNVSPITSEDSFALSIDTGDEGKIYRPIRMNKMNNLW